MAGDTWKVVHLITLPDGKEERRVELAVTGVPARVSRESLLEAITDAGMSPEEHGVPFANHIVVRGDGADGARDVIAWSRMTNLEPVRMVVRLGRDLHGQLKLDAAVRGQSLNRTFNDVLREYYRGKGKPV